MTSTSETLILGNIQMENSNDFLEMLQKIADEEGKTLEELVERIEDMSELMDQPLNEEGRLDYVERLLREKRIGPLQADMILRKNHVFHDEIREIAEDSKKVLYNEFGIQIPNYALVFDPGLNPKGFSVGTGLTSWIDQTISLPSEGLIQIPIIVAHEQGHASHMEESQLFRLLKEKHLSGDFTSYDSLRNKARSIIDGWPSFISKLYGQFRDRRVGNIKMYEQLADEVYGFMALLDFSQKTRERKGYYEGVRKFEDLFNRRGIETAKYAAYNLMSDYELSRF